MERLNTWLIALSFVGIGGIFGFSFGVMVQHDLMVDQIAAMQKVDKIRGEQVEQCLRQVENYQKLIVKATAYSNDPISINVPKWQDGMTATMTPARRGIVAADWRIFPPGTVLMIPAISNKPFVVEDRGGLVKGYHIDIFMDSYEEAREWGVQYIEVVVIKKGRRTNV